MNAIENIEASVGDEVVLVCEVTGNPQPLVWWEFRGIEEEPYALPGTSVIRCHNIIVFMYYTL